MPAARGQPTHVSCCCSSVHAVASLVSSWTGWLAGWLAHQVIDRSVWASSVHACTLDLATVRLGATTSPINLHSLVSSVSRLASLCISWPCVHVASSSWVAGKCWCASNFFPQKNAVYIELNVHVHKWKPHIWAHMHPKWTLVSKWSMDKHIPIYEHMRTTHQERLIFR